MGWVHSVVGGETGGTEVGLTRNPLSLAGILLAKHQRAQIEPRTPPAVPHAHGDQMFFSPVGVEGSTTP